MPELPQETRASLRDFLPATLLVNREAGRGRAARALPAIRDYLQQEKVPIDIFEAASVIELQRRCADAIAAGHRALLALGGDGTAQAIAQVAVTHRSEVAIGILPAGGGNDFAAALGVPIQPLNAARALMDAEIRCVDIPLARTADGGERIYLGGGGVGLDSEAAKLASTKYKHWRGRSRYVASALRAFVKFDPIRVEVESDGKEHAHDAPLLLAGVLNTPSYGAGLRFAPGARVDDGLLNVTLLEALSVAEILSVLPGLLQNGSLCTKRILRWECRQVRLTPDRPCLFHGDGELLGPAPVEVSVLPRALRMLVPRRNASKI